MSIPPEWGMLISKEAIFDTLMWLWRNKEFILWGGGTAVVATLGFLSLLKKPS